MRGDLCAGGLGQEPPRDHKITRLLPAVAEAIHAGRTPLAVMRIPLLILLAIGSLTACATTPRTDHV